MRTRFYYCILLIFFSFKLFAQTPPRQLAAKRTKATIKIDGKHDEAAWKDVLPATGFIEWRPNFGAKEEDDTRSEIYLLYDNTAIYIAGFLHEKSKDSVSKELVGRDRIGVNDYVGIVFDTYYDKINAVGFYVTPLGEQYDAKYSVTNGEDDSWNAVWDSEAQLVNDGWTFEMKIPYSALRFISKENQTWGLNITRNRKKAGRQFMWNPVDPKINGFVNQEGMWTGIEKIDAPVRLSLSPYFSAYLNHYPTSQKGGKDWTSSVNGGMDIKYGISDAFTLDMTLIPDFGQVRSDNQVLNLTPFEVRYEENRPFFTEGIELFSKGNLFYSRRIGSQPIHYNSAKNGLGPDEIVVNNPKESKLVNATKVSGRTKSGLGLGFFNAITKPMYATIQDSVTKEKRELQTGSLTNYNIFVVDQTLKNNSSISFINTSTIRNGSDYDANVSAALFNFNNKKNIYNLNGKVALSQIIHPGDNSLGYSHNVSVGKTGGNWNFQIGQELTDDKYNINDMGLQNNNNFIDHYLWTSYRWLKPTTWYNRIQVNYNAYYSRLMTSVGGQKINSNFQFFRTNVNANMQLKNLWFVGMFVGYQPEGNDFYEPRNRGFTFRSSRRLQLNPWVETNATKKYFVYFDYYVGLRQMFNSPNHQFNFGHRYRFNDKFSISHDLRYNPAVNDAGFYGNYYQNINGNYVLDPNGNKILEDILFSRRDLKTIENIFSVKYSFNNKSGITFRARHYWSKVQVKQLYDLQEDGSLVSSTHNEPINHQNFNIFNIDAVYTWQFAPGSFINIVWKDESRLSNGDIHAGYFGNFNKTIGEPQNNNLSFKVIYFLDYLDIKKWGKKGKG